MHNEQRATNPTPQDIKSAEAQIHDGNAQADNMSQGIFKDLAAALDSGQFSHGQDGIINKVQNIFKKPMVKQ
jgi:hypothetical protein